MVELNVKGQIILIDDEDEEKVCRWKWNINNSGYACRQHWNPDLKKYEKMYMHRYILNTPQGLDTDHINRNKLDNRKSNLRVATRSANNLHRGISQNNTSGITGVNFHKASQLWRAYIKHEGKQICLGYRRSKEQARILREEAFEKLKADGRI